MRKKYLTGDDRLIDLDVEEEAQIKVMLPVKGGADFY